MIRLELSIDLQFTFFFAFNLSTSDQAFINSVNLWLQMENFYWNFYCENWKQIIFYEQETTFRSFIELLLRSKSTFNITDRESLYSYSRVAERQWRDKMLPAEMWSHWELNFSKTIKLLINKLLLNQLRLVLFHVCFKHACILLRIVCTT